MRKKQEHDFSITAFRVVQKATEETEQPRPQPKKFDPVALGHLGGLIGGKAKAASLTPERRIEIAKKAAQVRWGKTS